MRSLDKMLYSVYIGAKNPERDKQHRFISERRQIKFVAAESRRAEKIKARRIDAGLIISAEKGS